MRPRAVTLAVSVAGLVGFLAGFGASWGIRTPGGPGLRKVAEVFDRVAEHYVEETKPEKLAEAAIDGVLDSLDPYSVYYTAQEMKRVAEDLAGKFSGVGILVAPDEDSPWVRVTLPIEGGPAMRAGVRPGDLILSVDGESIRGWKIDAVVGRIKGEGGTKVKLGILRPAAEGTAPRCPTCGSRVAPEGGERLEFEMERAQIVVRTVFPGMIDAQRGIGYLRVRSFTERLPDEFLAGLGELAAAGAKAYVIDLRFNGGGYLEGAVKVADLFLEAVPIVRTRGRESQTVRAGTPGVAPGLAGAPVAILVHDDTASASEILAGALQEHGIARVFGTRTHGKGTVQQIFALRDGSQVKLTTAYYTLPSGRAVDRRAEPENYGVRPDVEVAMAREDERRLLERWDREIAAPQEATDAVDAPLARALEWLRERLR